MRFRFFALAALLTAHGPALLPGLTPTLVHAQQKLPLTLEDIWTKPTFRSTSVPGFNWMNDGRYYSALESGSLVQHEVTTGKTVQTIVAAAELQLTGASLNVDGYSFNANEQKILFTTGTEPIYRHSARASYYVFDRGTKKLMPLSGGGKQGYATFSPDGQRVAFTRDNNVYVTGCACGCLPIRSLGQTAAVARSSLPLWLRSLSGSALDRCKRASSQHRCRR